MKQKERTNTMKSISFRQVITILATVLTLTINALASLLPLNGQDTGEIADRFDILFVPEGYVFSIWAVIYTGLILFTIYQALPSQKENLLLKKIAPYYWLSSFANSVWIFLWHYEIFSLTWIVMMIILGSLVFIYLLISQARVKMSLKQKTFISLPFSIYLGWISVATVANITQVLFYYDWSGWGISDQIWTVIMLGVASILGVLMILREKNIAYPLVFIWAFIGIAVKNTGISLIVTSAWAASILLSFLIITTPLFRKKTILDLFK